MVILEKDENILRVVRRHWFVMLPTIIGLLIMAVLPLIVIKYFGFDIGHLGAFLYSLWLLALWTMLFIDWTDYYLDVLLITNQRILNIEQRGFFNRQVISFRYSQIQDITVNTEGVIQTFFHFGLMQIQTAGEIQNIIIRHADNPEEARSLILAQQMRPAS